jgi:hypothetical protein
MAITYVAEGNTINQEDLVNKSAPSDYTMILYTARTGSPATLADLTEATTSGYAEVEMTGSGWTVTSIDSTYPQVNFNFTAAETVLGYAIKRDAVLIGWEDFSDGPYVVEAAGGTIGVNFKQNYTA